MTPLPDLSALASFEKKALTGALLARIEALTAPIGRCIPIRRGGARCGRIAARTAART